MEIFNNIHRITSPLGNREVSQYLLVGEKSWLLVDTGISGMVGERIAPYIDETPTTRNKQPLVLITHGDVDHLGGNHEVKRFYPNALLMAHKDDKNWIESKQAIMTQQYGWYAAHGMDYPKDVREWIERALGEQIPIDLSLSGGEEIRLSSDWSVTIPHLPGHSPGHIGVYDQRNKALIISDAVLSKGLHDISGRIISPPKYYDAERYVSTIRYVMKLNPDHLLTAHYGVISHEKIGKFLRESIEFVAKVEKTTLAALKKAATPLSLKELVEAVNPKVGPFISFEIELAAGILSHLNILSRRKIVRKTRKKGYDAWKMISGR